MHYIEEIQNLTKKMSMFWMNQRLTVRRIHDLKSRYPPQLLQEMTVEKKKEISYNTDTLKFL